MRAARLPGGGPCARDPVRVRRTRPSSWESRTSTPVTAPSPCRPRTTRLRRCPCAGRLPGPARQIPVPSGPRTGNAGTAPSDRPSTPTGRRSPVADVRDHIFTDSPWPAADPTPAPWQEPAELEVVPTGAWILPDERPLSPEVEKFLDAGEPPVYFGFGSIRAPHDLSGTMIRTARALGRRVIVSRGWADLALLDDRPDCLSLGDVNQQALFTHVLTGPRVRPEEGPPASQEERTAVRPRRPGPGAPAASADGRVPPPRARRRGRRAEGRRPRGARPGPAGRPYE